VPVSKLGIVVGLAVQVAPLPLGEDIRLQGLEGGEEVVGSVVALDDGAGGPTRGLGTTLRLGQDEVLELVTLEVVC
jgi:hypothetical protein